MSSYITIDGWKSNIRFSSAHIIPEYEKCGRLHGHTYAVNVKIGGNPDKKGIILDFSFVKETLRSIANDLDHKILIPEKSKVVIIEKDSKSVKINSLGKKYVFPLEDCVFLPISSTSAENLSKYLLEKFIQKISIPKTIEYVELGVDEGYGQGCRTSKKF